MPVFRLNRRSATGTMFAVLGALALTPVLGPAQAAIDSYMGFNDPAIQGDGPGRSIEIDSFSFGSQAPQGTAAGTGGSGTGKVTHGGTFSVTRHIDRISPALAAALASGKHFPQLSVTIHGQTTILNDVLIISTVRGGSPDSPTETVTFQYGGLQIRYNPQLSQPDLIHQQIVNPAVAPTKKP